MKLHDEKCETRLAALYGGTPKPCWCAERAEGYEYVQGTPNGGACVLFSATEPGPAPNTLPEGDVA